jgi:Zn-dependent protease
MDLNFLFVSLIILIFSAILHEIAHGFVADRLGDPTARLLGRLTLNPIPHTDPIMTIILPLILYIATHGSFIFGGAKPVPVDPFNLKEPKKDMALVSIAGPLTNFLIAFSAALAFNLLQPFLGNLFIVKIFHYVVYINLILGIFNLVPFPPLDGSKVFATFLPDDLARRYLSIGTFGIAILLMVMYLSPLPFSIIGNIVTNIMSILGMPL